MNLKTIQNVSRKALYGLVCGMMAAGLWSCSSDEPTPGPTPDGSKGDVYAKLTLALPTRSNTTGPDGVSSDGEEIGQDFENNVGSVLIILTKKTDDSYVTAAWTDALQDGNAGTARPEYQVQFESIKLAQAFGTAAIDVNVYAICNPTPDITAHFFNVDGSVKDSLDPLHKTSSLPTSYDPAVGTADFWKANAFVMSNKEVVNPKNTYKEGGVDKPVNYEYLITNCNKPEKAFELGTIEVQRACARFDFGPTTKDETLGENVYPIVNSADNKTVATVTIDGLALVNVAKEFYWFKHVSNDGLEANWTLLGAETANNYVVSPNSAAKLGETLFTGYFKQINGEQVANDLTFTTVASITNPDNDDDWNSTAPSKGDYYRWRYVTENTIPYQGTEAAVNSAQNRGITTGVVFRGQIKAGADAPKELKDAMAAGNQLYVYNNTLYGDKAMLFAAANKNVNSPLYNAVKSSFKAEDDGEGKLVVGNDLAKSDTKFDIYPATKVGSENKYYTYYYYWNRHNDNINPDKMGPMEFGVVRNNVYKLAVTNISGFGMPGDKPEDPDKPDEDPKAYFKVRVKVMPWIVRINNIEF